LKIIFFSILVSLFSTKTFAQAASASLFPEMLSINPATVGKRTQGVFSISPKIDMVKKELDASEAFGATGITISEDLQVTSGSIFYGGKGGFITSEIFLESASGEKKITLKSPTANDELKLSGDNMFLRYNLGVGKIIGLGLGYMTFNNKSEFTTTFQGQSFSNSGKGENKLLMIRPGFGGNLFGIDLGLYLEKVTNDNATTNSDAGSSTTTNTTEKTTYYGGAVGISNKTLHIEVAYEKQKEDTIIEKYNDDGSPAGQKTLNPSRATFVIEGKFGKLGLGYTGQYYQDGYINYQGFILNQLAYLNTREDARLENIFNFSWGSDKGHGFSGSFSTSSSKGKEKSLFTGNKQLPSTTTATAASLKYTYSW